MPRKKDNTNDAKIAVILVAYHHQSGNIAAQRFRGLLRHLPRNYFAVHVLAHSDNAQGAECHPEARTLTGTLISRCSGWDKLKLLQNMFFGVSLKENRIPSRSWIYNVVTAGRKIVQRERANGFRVVVMGTYSPIDALIAARMISDSEDVPLIQDFRDGLANASRGKPGRIYEFGRKIIEGWAVKPATRISTVSRPLVKYFAEVYASKEIDLLYNGFDPEIGNPSDEHETECTRAALTIGHFGRISASDMSSFESLKRFFEFLESDSRLFSGVMEFYGELTESEQNLISASAVEVVVHGHVSRTEVFAKMNAFGTLLLVTGDKPSTMTGKIFEYLFSGKRICLATMCQNEAVLVLQEIGDDDIVLDLSNPSSLPSITALEQKLSEPFVRDLDKICRFRKDVQSRQLAEMISSVA